MHSFRVDTAFSRFFLFFFFFFFFFFFLIIISSPSFLFCFPSLPPASVTFFLSPSPPIVFLLLGVGDE